MTNIFEQYGIKEVADVMIYKIGDNGEDIPYLFLDTLKVSTLEQTAEQTEARGGKGNSPLIIWDFGKEINITLEDALYSPRSMSLMWGGEKNWNTVSSITKTVTVKATANGAAPAVKVYDPNTKTESNATNVTYKDVDGNVVETANIQQGETYFATYTQNVSGSKIEIKADDFPGTYKIVGDTYARNRDTGEDEFFQFIIHRAKMSSENTLTLEAEGDPTVFNLNLRTLRPKDGNMIELIQYSLSDSPVETETVVEADVAAEAVEALIDDMTKASGDDKAAAIAAAREAYNQLSTLAQSLVSNIKALEDAEKTEANNF